MVEAPLCGCRIEFIAKASDGNVIESTIAAFLGKRLTSLRLRDRWDFEVVSVLNRIPQEIIDGKVPFRFDSRGVIASCCCVPVFLKGDRTRGNIGTADAI
jgi:hypothetical protein